MNANWRAPIQHHECQRQERNGPEYEAGQVRTELVQTAVFEEWRNAVDAQSEPDAEP